MEQSINKLFRLFIEASLFHCAAAFCGMMVVNDGVGGEVPFFAIGAME